MNVIDFGRSFVRGKAPGNAARFWIESRTRIFDQQGDRTEEYHQCGACKSENTFARSDLFVEDNYDFIPIWGRQSGIIFRSHAQEHEAYREVRDGADCLWGGPVWHLVERDAREVRTAAEIRDATHAFLPLVAETEIRNDDTRMRAVIQYPVKTMNVLEAEDIHQVDTGPVAFPDLSRRRDRLAEHIWLAFVAFNAEHFADFVIEAPTPIHVDGRAVARVPHYSRIVSLAARNRLFAMET